MNRAQGKPAFNSKNVHTILHMHVLCRDWQGLEKVNARSLKQVHIGLGNYTQVSLGLINNNAEKVHGFGPYFTYEQKCNMLWEIDYKTESMKPIETYFLSCKRVSSYTSVVKLNVIRQHKTG